MTFKKGWEKTTTLSTAFLKRIGIIVKKTFKMPFKKGWEQPCICGRQIQRSPRSVGMPVPSLYLPICPFKKALKKG